MTTKSNAPKLPEAWVEFISPFAEAIGSDVNKVSEALKQVVGEPGDEAIGLLQDAQSGATDEEIKSCFTKVPSARLRAAVNAHLRVSAPASEILSPTMSLDVLPAPKPDDSFIAALKVGGVSKVNQVDQEAGVKAALADRVDFFGIPKKIQAAMEKHAEVTEEPFGDSYYAVVKMITKRDYSEIFAALGVPASAVPQAKRTRFLSQIDSILWPAISSFNAQLSGWFDAWTKAAANPLAMTQGFNAAVAAVTGQTVPGMGAPLMTMPDTEPLRIAADEVVDKINRAYAGVGIPAARALAYEATQIKELLAKPEIVGLVGATTRELMLKELGIDVSANFVSMEHSVVKYVLAVGELSKQPKGSQQEQAYLQSLYQLGAAIPWEKLLAGKNGRRARSETSNDVRFDLTE